MGSAVLIRGGPTLYWLGPDGRVLHREPIDADPAAAAEHVADAFASAPEDRLDRWRSRTAGVSVAPELARIVPGIAPDPVALRAAHAALPPRAIPREREFLLPLASAALRRALADPFESLIALAREESRLERALGRERGAASQWVSVPGSPLALHADAQGRFGDQFARHHADLEERIRSLAREVLPNLTRLVGEKVAARLAAAAGRRSALSRAPAARIQLLGARRRPHPGGGPRFGVIYRAPGLVELSEDRQGRYARSLAALSAIALRADLHTRRDLGETLVRRRDRRLQQLRRRGA